jgi:hypothetical protein
MVGEEGYNPEEDGGKLEEAGGLKEKQVERSVRNELSGR